MPRYDYHCDCGEEFEAIAHYDDDRLSCLHCGGWAKRAEVYREQFIHCETGPKGGKKNEVPRDEKDLRKGFKEFSEASAEVDYLYSRTDDPKVRAPNHYKEGVKRAKQRGAKVNA